jgi:hypothetical protein
VSAQKAEKLDLGDEARELERLKKAIMDRVGSGFNATAYSSQEFFDLFCIKRERSDRHVYQSGTLDLAVSGLLEEGELVDFGGGWYGRPREKISHREEVETLA